MEDKEEHQHRGENGKHGGSMGMRGVIRSMGPKKDTYTCISR